ncbi:MAG: response regulator [Deltaproteobacteria bacterium]|nr:response regulator [Deltaproteobacteria bacterium]MBI4223334.1 response regulator [Deltaproteobacteria bacterium]
MVFGFKSKKKILIVDDNADTVEILKSLLEKEGYKVLVSQDGEEGVQIAAQQIPDLILMDINMPGLRGDMAAMRIRGEASTRHIPIVILTGVEDVQEKVLASQAGVVDYITKPYSPEKLLIQIKRLTQ